MQVRLYRFLLSAYGSGEWQPSGAVEGRWQEERRRCLPTNEQLRGKQPKDSGQIGAVLSKIHSSIGEPRCGQYYGGLGSDDWIQIASAKQNIDLARLRRSLDRRQIECSMVPLGGDRILQVRKSDYDAAVAVLVSDGHKLSSRRRGIRKARVVRRYRNWSCGLPALICPCVLLVTFMLFSASGVAADNALVMAFGVSFLAGLVLFGIGVFVATIQSG